MNKKGFTLVELLASIVILSMLIMVATPNITGISQTIKNNMYCSKLESIESAAELYAEDKYNHQLTIASSIISSSDIVNNGEDNMKISVLELIDNGYLNKDNDSCDYNYDKTTKKYSPSTVRCIEDPRGGDLDDYEFIIRALNKRATIEFVKTDNNASDLESCTSINTYDETTG